ncbi:MAG TPA: flagellar biosynthesis protein FlhA [Bryobacteraceae bacterium]|nr:flagellar biosynthesis protein FlhA [Bryobacteraceae bacterium]
MSTTKLLTPPQKKGFLGNLPPLQDFGDIGVPLAVLAIVLALITPLPSFLLDLLLVIDIMLSLIVMMVAMNIGRPVEFNVFPTTLLLLTLFRLALNVSSSRLILLNGNMGTSAAGHVIEAFGSFVVGGNYIIGTVIFLVLIAIQYVVINHGAVRISEVTARFTLDALPGKQMSIDADLNAGLIDEATARERRKQLAAEAEFYGAMDGASRFTQRDAVASILITSINIIAGFLIGVFQHGMDLRHALQTYTVLTIGDGLVTVIPALMISISGGLIITRASSDRKLGMDVQHQLFGAAQPLGLAGGVLIALAAFPGLPAIPFLLLGAGLSAVAWKKRRNPASPTGEDSTAVKAATNQKKLEEELLVDPLAIEIGPRLAQLVHGGSDSELLERLSALRHQIASELGYLVPAVRVSDNLSLPPYAYAVLVKGVEVARFEFLPDHELAISMGAPEPSLEGKPTTEPAFGLPALWIANEMVDYARSLGYTVVDAVSILGTHFSEVIRRHAHELFTRQDAKSFCDRVAAQHPRLVEEVVPKMLVTVQRVLQNLLREQVPIRDAVTILEAIGEATATTKNPVLVTEFVRQQIRRLVISPYLGAKGELQVYFLDPAVEQSMESAAEHHEQTSALTLPPQSVREILTRVRQKIDPAQEATVVTSPSVRYFLRQIVEATHPNLAVLCHNEIPPGIPVMPQGAI